MDEYTLTNRLAPETVPTVSGDELVVDFMAPLAPEEIAAIERELADANSCAACSLRVIALSRIRAALDACQCREVV